MRILLVGVLLVLLGIFLIISDTVLGILEQKPSARAEGGIVIFIGPIPIVVGSSLKAVLFAVILTIILMISIYSLLFWK